MCEKHIEKTLKHIETHWEKNTLKSIKTHYNTLHIKHIGDFAAFSNVPPMCPSLNVHKTH